MGARVLVVDDDPWILRMVTASLEKRRYVVDTAKEGRQALVRAEANPPDVIITDIMMPVMDGWTFVQKLRKNPRLASVPVIFLTALGREEAKLSEMGLSPEEYLSKPFRFDELEKRVSRALQGQGAPSPADAAPPPPNGYPPYAPYGYPAPQGGQPGYPGYPPAGHYPGQYPGAYPYPSYPGYPPQYGAPPVAADPRADAVEPPASTPHTPNPAASRRTTALNGRLEQLQLSSLLVMMEMERKAGVLTLKSKDGGLGRIFLRGGQVVSARLDHLPDRDGRESVYEMLCWQRGTFSFSAMEVDMQDTVQCSTTHLLMEGARLIDEANRDGSL